MLHQIWLDGIQVEVSYNGRVRVAPDDERAGNRTYLGHLTSIISLPDDQQFISGNCMNSLPQPILKSRNCDILFWRLNKKRTEKG